MNAARAAKLQDAVDRQSGEDVLIEPMAQPGGNVNARPAPDGARSPITVAGLWVEPQIEYARRPHDRAEGRNRDFSAARPTVKIQAVLVPYELQEGDRVTRVATGDRFQISAPGSDGFGRLLLPLTARRAGS